MMKKRYIEFLVVKFLGGSKMSLETTGRDLISITGDTDVIDDDASLMYSVLEKQMASIDTDRTCQIKIYADYIFKNGEIFFYSRTGGKIHRGLRSTKSLKAHRDKLLEMQAPEEILGWINALVAKSSKKNKIKLVFH